MLLSLLLRGVGMGGGASALPATGPRPVYCFTPIETADDTLGWDGGMHMFRPPWPVTVTEAEAPIDLLNLGRDPHIPIRTRRLEQFAQINFDRVMEKFDQIDERSEIVTTYDTAGTYTWVCPPGCTSVYAEAIGAGGSYSSYDGNSGGAGGGGGGAYAAGTLAVTPGKTYTVIVPDAMVFAVGELVAESASFQGDSQGVVAGSGYFTAAAGSGPGPEQVGGAGGTAWEGDVLYDGGDGGTGYGVAEIAGGGGGGAAGPNGSGEDGTDGSLGLPGLGGASNGGESGAGGNGVVAPSEYLAPTDAGNYGGGAGGGGGDTVLTYAAGDAGTGWVRLTYTSSNPTLVPAPSSATATGSPGQIAFDSSYWYWCYAVNRWARVAKSAW